MRESMATGSSRGMIRLTQILCFAAVAATIVSFWEGLAMPRLYAVETGVTALTAWGIGRWLTRRGARARNLFSGSETPAIFALAVVPLAGEGVARLFGWGLPAEILLVTSLRNAMIMLAFLPHVRAAQPAAAVSSLALTAMAFLVLWKWQVAVITCAYCFVGVWWLVGYSWDRLRAFRGEEEALSIPWRATSIAVAIVAGLAVAGALFATRSSAAGTLAGLFPSSGGQTWSDANAWGGVHDGDQAVGAEDDAVSFGPVETDLFLESEEPSLYDMFNETYQEPSTTQKRKQHRAIPLGAMPDQQDHVHRAENEKPSREFDAFRKPMSRSRAIPPSTKSRAVLQFVGRTPAHLRLETYNAWDGRSLSYRESLDASEGDPPTLRVESTGEKPWLTWPTVSPAADSSSEWRERSGIRVVRLDTNRIPTPEGLTQLHLAKLQSPGLFAWIEPGQLRLDQEEGVPQFTVFECESAPLDVSQYARSGSTPPPEPARIDAVLGFVPTAVSDGSISEANERPAGISTASIVELAGHWSAGASPGWGEIERIVDRLRTEAEFSPETTTPAEVDDAAEHFLCESLAGPDYLFATSAALLLRARGYDVRVASGFYVRPENFDDESQCTLVFPEDVHFWTEVRTVSGDWVVLEPTPGFERLAPPRSFARWAYELLVEFPEFVRRRSIATIALLIGLPLFWLLRREARLVFDLAVWSVLTFAPPRRRLVATRKLIERVGALSGRSRRDSQTLQNWLGEFTSDWPIDARWDVDAWLALSHASAFASRGVTNADGSAIDSLGRRLVAGALRRLVGARRDAWASRRAFHQEFRPSRDAASRRVLNSTLFPKGPMSAVHTHLDPARSSVRLCPHQGAIDALRDRLNRTILGKERAIELALACLLARGHLLLEDMPGLGKTTLAKALAAAVGGRFARVQCTPDLLPSDVTGFRMFDQKSREFEFVEGPVFCDVLLADEINRATPRSQSALFEAMAERQVTIDRVGHRLSPTFFVIATQNPVESYGAYPLPEAQLDRFAMKLSLGYPDRATEVEMLGEAIGTSASQRVSHEPIVDPKRLQELQCHVAAVEFHPKLREYLVDLGAATRKHRSIRLGLSPRGLLTWMRLAQARAHLSGRDFVIPDDILDVAEPTLAVRLSGEFDNPSATIAEILSQVKAPVDA